MSPQIGDADELLENVLGQDVGVTCLLDVIRGHIDVVGSEMQVGSRYGPDQEKKGELKPSNTKKIHHTPIGTTLANIVTNKSLSFHIPDSPFRLRGEGLCLVVGGGGGDDLVSVFVDGAGLCGCELRLLLRLFLDLGDLLSLLRRGGDLHAQDDVADLGLGQ